VRHKPQQTKTKEVKVQAVKVEVAVAEIKVESSKSSNSGKLWWHWVIKVHKQRQMNGVPSDLMEIGSWSEPGVAAPVSGQWMTVAGNATTRMRYAGVEARWEVCVDHDGLELDHLQCTNNRTQHTAYNHTPQPQLQHTHRRTRKKRKRKRNETGNQSTTKHQKLQASNHKSHENHTPDDVQPQTENKVQRKEPKEGPNRCRTC
jgi:hypothetical protein